MEFLIDVGISKETINKLEEKYDESILDLLELDNNNVIEVIKYLKEIGINNIDELLVFKIELFTKELSVIKNAFKRHDIKTFVNDINEDIINIDIL